MERKEYRTRDKTTWPRGEWDNEFDKAQFVDEATGLPCLIVRNNGGALCGYVGVAEGHPLFGKGYNDIDVNVHGGLTFADFCHPSGEEDKRICHIPGEGEPDHVYWLGFDTAHGGDFCPAYAALDSFPVIRGIWDREDYRNVAYVEAECASLAQQLARMK